MTSISGWAIHLSVESGPHAGLQKTFSGHRVCIGRAAGNEMCLGEDTTVSGEHAMLLREGDAWFVVDRGSRNGVLLEAGGALTRVVERIRIEQGARLHLGSSILEIRLGAQPEAPPAAPAPAECVVLQIILQSGQLKYRFFDHSPMSNQHTLAYSEAIAGGIQQQLDDFIRLSQSGVETLSVCAPEVLREVGELLARQLIPGRVLEKLDDVAGKPLLLALDSELITLPWELAHAGGAFWCERHDLGRQVVLEDYTVKFPEAVSAGPVRLLLVCNPTGDLPEVQEDAEGLLRELGAYESWLEVEFLAGRRVTIERLLRRMEGARAVYYVGHGVYDAAAPDRSGWVLSDGPLTLGHFRNLSRPPRLVFSNACDSARETGHAKGVYAYAENIGMASRFLFAGVEAYVGAQWPIPVASSGVFASELWHALFRGSPLGAAVREARTSARRVAGVDETGWASYVLYGDPRMRLRSGAL